MGNWICCYRNQNIEPELEIPPVYSSLPSGSMQVEVPFILPSSSPIQKGFDI